MKEHSARWQGSRQCRILRENTPGWRKADWFRYRRTQRQALPAIILKAAEIGIYSIYFILGGSAGLLGVCFILRVIKNFFDVIAEPLKDLNFRQILIFLGSWNFAINLTAPFFSVYMLKRLSLNMSLIVALSVLNQRPQAELRV